MKSRLLTLLNLLHNFLLLFARFLRYGSVFLLMLILLFAWLPVPYTGVMLERQLTAWSTQKNSYQARHHWVAIDNMSGHMLQAVVAAEDQKFLQHHGFDMQAIERAFVYNSKGKKVRGASTISQQTAKNVFLWPQRSWFRKGLEAYFTFLIELVWSKERIMEVYLNSIEMGNGIYGIEAASQYWFKKPASRLSQQEAAAIAAILPNPKRYRANPASNYIQSRKQWIVRQMYFYGPFSYDSTKKE